ncbi:MAG: glycosyltransferase family 2 protein [archaeon]
MYLSIVIPAYNEEKNVVLLYDELKKVLGKLKKDYEIFFIDDGSTDQTFENLTKLNSRDKKVRVIKLRKNFGQTAAMNAGFSAATGELIITMDSDLQNDPSDIPRLIEKINEGYDVVSGWRENRKDNLSKRIFSVFANSIRRTLTGEKIHDSGCSLKSYRKECFDGIDLYGEMHRYIPAILSWKGYKVTEIKVNHRQRKFGKTKYNLLRLIKGGLDLIVVAFWQRYSARPMHVFGTLGLLTSALGSILGIYLAYLRLILGQGIANRPLLLLAILLVILGIQFLIYGLLADIMIKLYYSSRKDKNYSIEKIL